MYSHISCIISILHRQYNSTEIVVVFVCLWVVGGIAHGAVKLFNTDQNPNKTTSKYKI